MSTSNDLGRVVSALPALLTAKEVAAYLRVNRATLDRWVQQEQFPPPVKLGKSTVRFRREVVDQYLAQSETTAPFVARTRKAAR